MARKASRVDKAFIQRQKERRDTIQATDPASQNSVVALRDRMTEVEIAISVRGE